MILDVCCVLSWGSSAFGSLLCPYFVSLVKTKLERHGKSVSLLILKGRSGNLHSFDAIENLEQMGSFIWLALDEFNALLALNVTVNPSWPP